MFGLVTIGGQVEDQFLTCYILKMSSSEEFYLKFLFCLSNNFYLSENMKEKTEHNFKEINFLLFNRRNILPANAINYPKTSPEFFQALKQAATVRDCVDPENPLDISHRTRYKYEASDLGCFTEKLGFQYPEELDLALAACPTSSCLGTFCQMVFFFLSFFPALFPFSSLCFFCLLIFMIPEFN